jgi:hypothetical protein
VACHLTTEAGFLMAEAAYGGPKPICRSINYAKVFLARNHNEGSVAGEGKRMQKRRIDTVQS